MPNQDGTGPIGKGPMSGYGRGYCVVPMSNPKKELEYLKNQEKALETQLKQIKDRIKEVEKEARNARI